MDDISNISALRIMVFDCCGKRAGDYMRPLWPRIATRIAWIPQTLGEQIWVLCEFASEADRLAWESILPPDVSRWLDRRLLPDALRYGWGIRDENGFLSYGDVLPKGMVLLSEEKKQTVIDGLDCLYNEWTGVVDGKPDPLELMHKFDSDSVNGSSEADETDVDAMREHIKWLKENEAGLDRKVKELLEQLTVAAVEKCCLESKLREQSWRPIAEYVDVADRECQFMFASRGIAHHTMFSDCTHFLQLPPVPGE